MKIDSLFIENEEKTEKLPNKGKRKQFEKQFFGIFCMIDSMIAQIYWMSQQEGRLIALKWLKKIIKLGNSIKWK